MPIESPLRRYAYEAGALIQACPECDWAQDGHRKELLRCPACDAELGDMVAIHFGGLLVVYKGSNFDIHSRNGGFVSIERADYADVIQFLCRHGCDERADPYWGMPRVRRVAKYREFDDTCIEAWLGPKTKSAKPAASIKQVP